MQQPPLDYVEQLVVNMHKYNPEDYIVGSQTCLDYDEDVSTLSSGALYTRTNPLPDKQLNLVGHRAKTSLPFQFTFYIVKMQNDQPASSSPVIVLHPKQNIESELKWQTWCILSIKMNQNATA